jgi:hypothetical protein
MKKQHCSGKRRMWRGHTLGNYKCGRVATHTFETRVGMTRKHATCGADECVRSVTQGYPAFNFREVSG